MKRRDFVRTSLGAMMVPLAGSPLLGHDLAEHTRIAQAAESGTDPEPAVEPMAEELQALGPDGEPYGASWYAGRPLHWIQAVPSPEAEQTSRALEES